MESKLHASFTNDVAYFKLFIYTSLVESENV